MKKWMEAIEKEVQKGKNLILIAGASSSGKSFNSERLTGYLSKNNGVLLVSADNFYKGVAKIAVEKTIQKEPFIKYKNFTNEISIILKQITLSFPLQEKLKGEQIDNFKKLISPYIPVVDQDKFIDEILYQFANMNFDEPFAIDFDLLASKIKSILNKEITTLPQYSFHSSEIDKSIEINSKDYDLLIVEGLYALRDELLSKLQDIDYVTAAIDCDPNTLLSRRLNRDILQQRSKLTPELILISFLDVIMPAYAKFILPTLNNAKYILNTSLTEKEVNAKNSQKQVKFSSTNAVHNNLNSLGAKKIDVCKQKDYYLENKNNEAPFNLSISLREIDNLITKLTFKFQDSNFSRKIESYDLTSFSKENRQSDKMMSYFKNGGFLASDIVEKTRTTYLLDGKILRIDEVENLGTFIELENDNINLYKKFSQQLNMNKPIKKSYRELTKKRRNLQEEFERN